MKKLAARLLIVSFFTCFLCFSIVVSAEKISEKNYTIETVTQLQQFLLGQTSGISEDFDINSDRIINSADLSLMKQYVLYDVDSNETVTSTTTSSPNESQTTTNETETTKEEALETLGPIPTMPRYGMEYLENSLDLTKKTTITIPNYNSDLHEVKDGAFLFENNNVTYAYSLLCDEQPSELNDLFSNVTKIKGIHVWKYDGDEQAVSIYDELPDTTGLTFQVSDPRYEGLNFKYKLIEYASLNYGYVVSASELVDATDEVTFSDISFYDYNLNGKIDSDDVTIMTKYAVAQPFNLFDDLNRDTFNRYFNKMSDYGHTHMVFLRTDSKDPVPYAFNIPSADVIFDPTESAADRNGLEYADVPVQILPNSYAEQLAKYPEITKLSDKTADYYAWFPQEKKWAKVANESKIWHFEAGFCVYLVDDDGNPILQHIIE